MWQAAALALTLSLGTFPASLIDTPPARDGDMQADLQQIYSIIDQAIATAKSQGKTSLILELEDPCYDDKGFSQGFLVLLQMLRNHYRQAGYTVLLAARENKARMQIAWDNVS